MSSVNRVDIVYGADWGDGGKGKVASFLAERKKDDGKPFYDFVARWGGGQNAGHTIYIDGKVYKTHIIPSGVFHGIKSLIGPGCVFNPDLLLKEMESIVSSGADLSLLKIHGNAHIVTKEHMSFDKTNLAKKLGTTSMGIAPAYADKFARVGQRFCDWLMNTKTNKNSPDYAVCMKLMDHLFDGMVHGNILCEGAQGFHLDINWGRYPYVTSSETLPYAACSIGFSPKKIKNIFAIAKIYDTRSGEDPIFPDSLFENKELLAICDAGKEFGTTTGRRRKVNYLNLDYLIKAIVVSGGTHMIISKCDILESLGIFRLYHDNNLVSFKTLSMMKEYIEEKVRLASPEIEHVIFSSSPKTVEFTEETLS
jgi:adenylosuccinate synthase